ncbi:hypothetical protein BS47DRAFT_1396495 [Hydnum rufescens UP504]|uniref:Exocyst complex component Sec10 n=1 Tax=Hydnum rufescens UP504 TaxID=1448309 RepID=A0A9P6AQ16_9AGAM|nr:hypothetical protein BS47DRAFT_1396495 [Hydnum rufescens UP504]
MHISTVPAVSGGTRRDMARNDLYAPDPALQELLKLKTFEDNFDIQEFIGGISDNLIAQSKEDTGPFDPAPFIRTFESSVDALLAIRKDVQTKKEAMEDNVRIAEREFSRKLAELNSGFEARAVGKSFSGMENKISQVGKTAIRIGEQLESIHISRRRAQAAHDLIDYYNQFSHSDTSRLDTLRKDGGKAGRQQVAVILRRLVTVAKEADVPGAEETRNRIDKYCELFEKDMLNLFDKSYLKGDPKMMGHCAQTLLDFNGGASCVQVYVNQHDFFISKSKFQEINITEESQMWDILPDPDTTPPKEEPGLTDLFREIRHTAGQESEIIQAVFPNPPFVMQVFLQRVFAQSIQQYLELLLTKAQSSTLAYLRILQLAHVQVSKLVEDLKAYDISSALSPRSPSTAEQQALGSGVVNPAAPGAGAGLVVAIGTMLENAMEELFVPYNEGTKYLDKETKSLSEIYSTYLNRFTKYHEAALKAKSTKLFDRLAQLASTTATSTTASGAGAAAQAAATAAFMNISGRIRAGVGTNGPTAPVPIVPEKPEAGPPPFTEDDGRLNVDVAEKILKWHAEAVGRCVELSPPSDLARNAFALMKELAEILARSYVETAIESAVALVEARDPKLEPDLQPIYTLKQVDMICHLWQQYVNVALLPLANNSVTVRREMTVFNNQTISRIEGASNGMLQRVADSIISWLSAQLAKQKKNDFKPRNDDISFARVNTEPCEACCDCLEKVRDAAKECISGKNLEAFLMDIGVSFHTLLLDHLKKFPVSATGGLMLAKDLRSYQDTIATFALPSLSERFEFIRQLGNVFLVRPEILKSYITENYLGRIEPALLRPYLMQRSDWSQFERAFDFVADPSDALGGTPTPGTGGTEGIWSGTGPIRSLGGVGNLKDRFAVTSVSNRLSTMMRDLENIRIGGIIQLLTVGHPPPM